MSVLSLEPWSNPAAPQGTMRLSYARPGDGKQDWTIWWPGQRTGCCAVCFHGHGSGADQLYVRKDIRELWMPSFRRLGLSLLTPGMGNTHWMGPQTVGELHWLLGEVRRRFGIERFYFVGGSMGGASVLTYAVLHPQDVRAIVSLCPVTDAGRYHGWLLRFTEGIMLEIRRAIEDAHGGPPSAAAEVYAAHAANRHASRLTMPLLLVHAEGDAAVPVEESRQLAAELKGKKDFTYVEMPGGNHDSPIFYTPMWDWLGSQVEADDGR